MDYYAMTDAGVEKEIGHRLKELRLRKNLTQAELADAVSVARATIERLENGNGKISTLIAVLRELGQLDNLDLLIPDQPVSPLVLAERQGRKRERAGKKRVPKQTPGTTW